MPTESRRTLIIIVEHLDPELEDWQALEYKCIADECNAADCGFTLSGLSSAPQVARQLALPSSHLTEQSVETLYPTNHDRQKVCLLDPKAALDLSPGDDEIFDAFLFGGILGDDPPRGIELSRHQDPNAALLTVT